MSTVSPTSAPDMAQVMCGTDPMTSLSTPVIQPRADGVHLRTTNGTGEDRAIEAEEVGGDDAPVGVSETIWQIGPGTTRVRCFDMQADAGIDVGWVSLAMVDPEGIYRSAELDCAGAIVGSIDYVEGATSEHGDPVILTKAAVIGLLLGDVVEAAGYPEAADRRVRIVRGSRVIAWLGWSRTQDGGWLLDTQAFCSGTGIETRPTE
jgi:hypothetical protein